MNVNTKLLSISVICYLAVEAMVSLRAGALVCAIAVLTGASIHAGSGVALVDVMLAVVTSEPSWAQASEAVDAIHACATIKTRAVWREGHDYHSYLLH